MNDRSIEGIEKLPGITGVYTSASRISLAKVKRHKVDQRRTWSRMHLRETIHGSTDVRATATVNRGISRVSGALCLGHDRETFSPVFEGGKIWEIQRDRARAISVVGAKCVFRVLPCFCSLSFFLAYRSRRESQSTRCSFSLSLSLAPSFSLRFFAFFHGHRSWQQTAAATTTTVAVAASVVKQCNRNGHERGKKLAFSHPRDETVFRRRNGREEKFKEKKPKKKKKTKKKGRR